MEKQAIRELLGKSNEEEKNEYIMDLSCSIQEYIKSGIANDVLCNFQQYASEIKCELTKVIDENTELIDTFMKGISSSSGIYGSDMNFIKSIQQKLNDNMDKLIYLSHLNMLAELYLRESEKREEQREYVKVTEEFPKLLEISTEINAKRRVSGCKLKEQFKLTDKEYRTVTVNYKKYFNFHKGQNNETGQVSLSPKGRKYLKCMNDVQNHYTQSQVDFLVVKNCEAVIHSISVSLVKSMPQQVSFSGITPQSQRNIQCVFDQEIYGVTRLSSKAYPIRRTDAFEIWGKECYNGIGENFTFPILPLKGNC